MYYGLHFCDEYKTLQHLVHIKKEKEPNTRSVWGPVNAMWSAAGHRVQSSTPAACQRCVSQQLSSRTAESESEKCKNYHFHIQQYPFAICN